MSFFSRGLILTLLLTVIAAVGGTWIGARYIYDQRHQPSLHEFVHEELKLAPEQRKRLDVPSRTSRFVVGRGRPSCAPPTPSSPGPFRCVTSIRRR